MPLPSAPSTYVESRHSLHVIAAQILGRWRASKTDRFGLRAAPGGFATPAVGTGAEVLRVSRGVLVHERTGTAPATHSIAIDGSSLDELAAFAEIRLTDPFEGGKDAPPVSDPTTALHVDDDSSAVIAEWLSFACPLIDGIVAGLGPTSAPNVLQLWPEHFDAGLDVAVGSGRVNLGASMGDSFHPLPYLYVGPWDTRRPGEPSVWNAPFGAVLTYEQLQSDPDAASRAKTFFQDLLTALAD